MHSVPSSLSLRCLCIAIFVLGIGCDSQSRILPDPDKDPDPDPIVEADTGLVAFTAIFGILHARVAVARFDKPQEYEFITPEGEYFRSPRFNSDKTKLAFLDFGGVLYVYDFATQERELIRSPEGTVRVSGNRYRWDLADSGFFITLPQEFVGPRILHYDLTSGEYQSIANDSWMWDVMEDGNLLTVTPDDHRIREVDPSTGIIMNIPNPLLIFPDVLPFRGKGIEALDWNRESQTIAVSLFTAGRPSESEIMVTDLEGTFVSSFLSTGLFIINPTWISPTRLLFDRRSSTGEANANDEYFLNVLDLETGVDRKWLFKHLVPGAVGLMESDY